MLLYRRINISVINYRPKPSTVEIRFHRVALVVVGFAASIGLLATVIAWATRGEFAATTFATSLGAFFAAHPVFRKYRQLVQVHQGRNPIVDHKRPCG